MDCIMESYLKHVDGFFNNYYRILLGRKYDRNLVRPFIDKYLAVRYYNNAVYVKENTFIEKINKELHTVAKDLIKQNEEKEDLIKNVFALFSYLLYLDDCIQYKSVSQLVDTLFEDQNIKLQYEEQTKIEFKNLVTNFVEQKKEFFEAFKIGDFTLRETRIKRNLYKADLNQECEISPLYSEYAIKKAYEAEVVAENKLYLILLLLSKQLIESTIKMDYSRRYIVDFPVSLLEKPKKQKRFIRVLDNDILKNKINIRVKYSEYQYNKNEINKLIAEGFSMALTLDETFDNDFNSLVLFQYVFVDEKYDYYDIIAETKDTINTTIITI